jgi:hypothetical protein
MMTNAVLFQLVLQQNSSASGRQRLFDVAVAERTCRNELVGGDHKLISVRWHLEEHETSN